MLILARKLNESIVIGGQVKVTITSIQSNGVIKLGIEAPPEVRVDREEVHKQRKGDAA